MNDLTFSLMLINYSLSILRSILGSSSDWIAKLFKLYGKVKNGDLRMV